MLAQVKCYTNEDDYKTEEWPSYMYNPQVGDTVTAKSGKRLQICSLVHLYNDTTTKRSGDHTVLEIELFKKLKILNE
jgi:hypothetical protein